MVSKGFFLKVVKSLILCGIMLEMKQYLSMTNFFIQPHSNYSLQILSILESPHFLHAVNSFLSETKNFRVFLTLYQMTENRLAQFQSIGRRQNKSD